jgi:hypothetical protein
MASDEDELDAADAAEVGEDDDDDDIVDSAGGITKRDSCIRRPYSKLRRKTTSALFPFFPLVLLLLLHRVHRDHFLPSEFKHTCTLNSRLTGLLSSSHWSQSETQAATEE